MPIPKNEADMRGEGWKKELTIKRIVVKQGVIFCQEYDFFADKFPCSIRDGGTTGPKCGLEHAWIRSLNGKLFSCCFRHRTANGPISFETGSKAREYPVSAEEAVKICSGQGVTPPKEVMEAWRTEKATKDGTRRRPRE